MKIDWSGRSHKYSSADTRYLTNIIKNADQLTQGKYLKKFEKVFSSYIGKKNVSILKDDKNVDIVNCSR